MQTDLDDAVLCRDGGASRSGEQVGKERVICALSGGVDSSVAAALTHRAIGDQLTCIFVDNGVLRAGEREQVQKTFASQLHLNLRILDRDESVSRRLEGRDRSRTETKDHRPSFHQEFRSRGQEVEGMQLSGPGHTVPDVIESVSFKGPSATIKTHHNVGGLPARMRLKLIEPLARTVQRRSAGAGQGIGIAG